RRVHDHAFRDARGARDLKLGHLLDFDETDAAQSGWFELRMIAIDRYLRAQTLCGFDDERPLGHGQDISVDGDADQAGADRLCAHAALSLRTRHRQAAWAHAALSLRTRNGQPAWLTCALNSSGKRFITDCKNGMIESPSAQRFVPVMV